MKSLRAHFPRHTNKLLLLLVVFFGISCALLVGCAHQRVHDTGMSADQQRRAACLQELSSISTGIVHRLNVSLDALTDKLRKSETNQVAFWNDALGQISSDQTLKMVFVLSPKGKLITPAAVREPVAALAGLSLPHPLRPTLIEARRAHWIDGDYPRAIELYWEVRHQRHVLGPIYAVVASEMAQIQWQQGDIRAALPNYGDVADDDTLERKPDPIWWYLALARAVENAAQSGTADEQMRGVILKEGPELLLEDCESKWMTLPPNHLAFVVRKLKKFLPAEQLAQASNVLDRIDQMARLSFAMGAFAREYGADTFQLAARSEDNHQQAIPIRHDSADAKSNDPHCFLVNTGSPLSDGNLLGVEFNVAALRETLLEPALRKMTLAQGGRFEIVPTMTSSASEKAPVEKGNLIIFQLPAPLDFWTVRYEIQSPPLPRRLPEPQSVSRTASPPASVAAETPQNTFQEAMYLELGCGDLAAAAKLYKEIAGNPQANSDLKACAQLRLGYCQEQLGKTMQAVELYTTLVQSLRGTDDSGLSQVRYAATQSLLRIAEQSAHAGEKDAASAVYEALNKIDPQIVKERERDCQTPKFKLHGPVNTWDNRWLPVINVAVKTLTPAADATATNTWTWSGKTDDLCRYQVFVPQGQCEVRAWAPTYGPARRQLMLIEEMSFDIPAALTVQHIKLPARIEHVYLKGNWLDNWSGAAPLDKVGDGVWETRVRLKPGSYEYKFRIDDLPETITDVRATKFVDDGKGDFNAKLDVAEETDITFRFDENDPHFERQAP
jgi:tetratricopeptide (TPR) repeat protein